MNPQGFRSLLRRPARGRRSRLTLVPVLGLALAAAATAAEDEADERVRSVASRLPAAASNADPFPLVTVIDRDDLELSGAKSVEDLVLRRFGNNLFGLYRPLVVGSGGVAFLVNGRPVSDFIVDLDTLPLSAVERIELLNGTAAGLHGGHAVAGAINVVLGRDYEGTEVRVGTDRPDTAGGDAEHGSARWGGRVGRGHLTIGVDAIRRKEVRDADRDYSRTAFVTGGPILGTTGVSPSGNTIEFTVDPGEGEKKLGRYGILGECSEDVYTGPLTLPAGLGSVCGYAYADSKWLDGYGGRERGALFLAADHPLGERADLHVDARAALGESDFRYAPSVGTFEYTLPADVRNRLAEEHGTVPANIEDEATLNHRFVAHGDRDWQTDVEEYDLALGVRGRFAISMHFPGTGIRFVRPASGSSTRSSRTTSRPASCSTARRSRRIPAGSGGRWEPSSPGKSIATSTSTGTAAATSSRRPMRSAPPAAPRSANAGDGPRSWKPPSPCATTGRSVSPRGTTTTTTSAPRTPFRP